MPSEDKGAHLSLRERVQIYGRGWRDGAAMKVVRHEGYTDYERGYKDGRQAFGKAMEAERQRLGAPPPSILRAQSGEEAAQA